MANQDVKNTQETGVIVSNHENSTVDIFDGNQVKAAKFFASEIASSSMVPFHYQNKPQNVLVAMYKAKKIGMDVFAYMDSTYIVGGKTGHEAKLVIALLNKCGKFKGPIRFKFEGEIFRGTTGQLLPSSTRKCTAWAILKEDGEKVEQTVELSLAFREGWIKNPKWHSMTDEMLQYRSASFFGNMNAPEVKMGFDTREELEDSNVVDAEVIEQTETGKDIFVKGETVNTAAEPVLDPAMEIRTEPVVAPVEVVVIPEVKPVEATKPAEVKVFVQIDTSEVPPTDPIGFGTWVQGKFEKESTTIDAFLVAKKWIRPGEAFPALTTAKLTKLRGMWEQFSAAYETFRKAGER